MKKIYLIRHGQTEFNVQKRSQGAEADIELNNNGKQEAEYTGYYLRDNIVANKTFDVIYSPPLSRAFETAKIIKKHHFYNITKMIL